MPVVTSWVITAEPVNFFSGETIANSIIGKVTRGLSSFTGNAHYWIKKLGSLYVQHWYSVTLTTLAHLGTQGWIKHWRKNFRFRKNKVVRFIKKTWTPLTYWIFWTEQSGFLNVEKRVKHLRLNHVFKIFNGTCPSYLSEHFRKVSDLHMYNTGGSSENFVVPHESGHASTTFFFNGIKDWNSLPPDIKRVHNFNRFKTSVKRFLNSEMQLMEAVFFFFFFVTIDFDFIVGYPRFFQHTYSFPFPISFNMIFFWFRSSPLLTSGINYWSKISVMDWNCHTSLTFSKWLIEDEELFLFKCTRDVL